jgi:hypothetical protein
MRRDSSHSLFAHFQNLNLLVLIEDLRRGLAASGNWAFDHTLCPVSHGMPDGATVGQLQYLSQAADLETACALAAQRPRHATRSRSRLRQRLGCLSRPMAAPRPAPGHLDRTPGRCRPDAGDLESGNDTC